jgi:glutamate carboxypeptidase
VRKENPDVPSAHLVEGVLTGDDPNRFITFVCHADVVLGIEIVGAYRKDSDGLRAQGPGVIDNKGGVVVALEGLRLYLKKLQAAGKKPALSLRFVSSPNEEAGSPGFQNQYALYARDSKIVLGFEPALDNGSIIESRRGNRWYDVRILGQEAHAGRCKGEEINAAHDAAKKITRLSRLNHLKNGISVNVGQIKGGRERYNVVCGMVEMKIDARFSTFAARERLHKQIEHILLRPVSGASTTGSFSKTTYTIADDCPPFASTLASRHLLKGYLSKIKEIEGRKIRAEKAGGAGDVNYMSALGVVVLDGLGAVGGHMHTENEFIFLPSLSTRAVALSAFLERIEKKSQKRSTVWRTS